MGKQASSNENQYYSLKDILSHRAVYNVIFGERSNGKTYAVLEYALKRYCAGKGKLAVIRRWDEDFKAKRGASLFSAHVQNGLVTKLTKGKWTDIYYYSGRWYLCTYDDKGKRIKEDEPFAYAFSLSTMEHDKSTSFPDITTALFDEFLTRDAYMIDEFVIFTNVLSTIIRQRDDVKIFMLGNTVNQYSPYFTEMGLTNVRKMKPGDIEVYSYDDKRLKVAVEYTEPSATTKKSNFYFAFNNPKLNMIKNGSWEFANYPHCPMKYRPADIALAFFIKWEEDILQCEIVIVNDSYFIFIHKKTTPLRDTMNDLIYSVDYSPRPNYKRNLLKPMSYIEKQIDKLFAEYKVFYQDNQVGEIVRNYLQWCKQN